MNVVTDDMVQAALDAYSENEWRTSASAMRAALAAVTPPATVAAGWVVEQGWQPIETAPRDGTAVLCWPFEYSSMFEGKADPEIVIGFFAEDDWWCESTVAKKFEPTHWRLLPAAPEPQQ